MSTGLPLPLSIADLPVGATFTHKGVEYRKVFNKGVVDAAIIMAARHPDHEGVFPLGGQLGAPPSLSICAECPASGSNNHRRMCSDVYTTVPCHTPDQRGSMLILTVDTAYEMALAGCVSW